TRIRSELQIIVVRVVKIEVHHRRLVVPETEPESSQSGAGERVVPDQVERVPPDGYPSFDLKVVSLTHRLKAAQDRAEAYPESVTRDSHHEKKDPQHPDLSSGLDLPQKGNKDQAERGG